MFELLQSLPAGAVLGIVAILGGTLVLVVLIFMTQWRSVREVRLHADLKRDLLARGLPVDEIERLATPAQVRLAQIEADRRTKESQLAADLRRDLVARGLSVEEVERLAGAAGQTSAGGASREAQALADTICSMVHEGGLDRDAVAGLIDMFIKKQRTPEPAERRGSEQVFPRTDGQG